MRRRALLLGSGVGLAALAGCASDSQSDAGAAEMPSIRGESVTLAPGEERTVTFEAEYVTKLSHRGPYDRLAVDIDPAEMSPEPLPTPEDRGNEPIQWLYPASPEIPVTVSAPEDADPGDSHLRFLLRNEGETRDTEPRSRDKLFVLTVER